MPLSNEFPVVANLTNIDKIEEKNCDKINMSNHFFSFNSNLFTVDNTKIPPSTKKDCVIHGYPKPNMSRLYYLNTLWTLNNETINVWSHLVTGLYFGWMLNKYSQELDIINDWPVLVIILSAITVALCSAAAHTFHARSEVDHSLWMLVDFFGIIVYAFGSTVTHFFACSELSYYKKFGYWNIAMLTFNCCIVFFCLSWTKTPSHGFSKPIGNLIRVISLGFGYFYGILPIFYRFWLKWNCESLQYHALCVFFMLISPYFYATNKPQCFKPGFFDIVGHNHQIFHLSISLMLYFDISAVHADVVSTAGHWNSLKVQDDHPRLLDVLLFASFIVIWCSFVGYSTIRCFTHPRKKTN